MYKSIFPAKNNDSTPYNNILNNEAGIYFSANASKAIAKKLTATKIKYIFFFLFIMSLGIIISYLFSSIRSSTALLVTSLWAKHWKI